HRPGGDDRGHRADRGHPVRRVLHRQLPDPGARATRGADGRTGRAAPRYRRGWAHLDAEPCGRSGATPVTSDDEHQRAAHAPGAGTSHTKASGNGTGAPTPVTYAAAGVDTRAGDQAVELMKQAVRATHTDEVL